MSPTGAGPPLASDPGKTCGLELLVQFVADPGAALDLSCQSDQLPLDFGPQPELAQMLFGQTSLWDLPSPPASPPALVGPSPLPGSPALRRALGEALRAPR